MPPDTNSRGLLRVAEERIDRDWNTYTKLAEIGCVRNPVEDYIVVTYPPRTTVDDLSQEERMVYSDQIMDGLRGADEDVRVSGYVHFPFCSRRCTFCHYLSDGGKSGDQIESYLRVLSREISTLGSRLSTKKKLRSLFIGGGSPSIMTPEDLYVLLEQMRQCFDIPTGTEVTLELHPEAVRRNPEMYLDGIKQAGINRVNVGLQSADQRILDASNRGHTVEEAVRLHEMCKELGLTTNIDLIWGGLFGDNSRSFLESLELAFSQDPDTVTTYHMWLRQGTPEFQRYTERPYMYPNWLETLRERILANLVAEKYGYTQEYIDWYRRSTSGKSYQQQRDKWGTDKTILLPFGSGVYGWNFISSDRNFMYWHPFNTQEYQRLVMSSQLPIDRCIVLDNNETARRHIIFRLKSGGIAKDDFGRLLENAPGIRLDIENKMAKLIDLGLIEEHENTYRLTDVGSWIGDEVASTFTSEDVLRRMKSRGSNQEEKKYEWYVDPKMVRRMKNLVGD